MTCNFKIFKTGDKFPTLLGIFPRSSIINARWSCKTNKYHLKIHLLS